MVQEEGREIKGEQAVSTNYAEILTRPYPTSAGSYAVMQSVKVGSRDGIPTHWCPQSYGEIIQWHYVAITAGNIVREQRTAVDFS